ncbi:MAG: lysophospholipid acyltransferase family protein [Reichenbachiella sp.]|uniref:lysophospholipid acyltransferase family protein n=1 Tax=Reichenbachiella sp. TaxID=2184521 RepID=UPI0032657D83
MIVIKYIWYYTMWTLVKIGLHLYYSKIKISGRKNIPKNTPIIFGSNHENAFIDALLITTSNTRFDHYLVRAGVFNNRVAKFFLNSLNLMPVYRAQDGVNPLEANQQIFRACFEALAKKYAVMLFPEGEHNIRRHRRVLKKGITRIALGAVNFVGGTKQVSVVPVGVNYSDHTGFRSAVHIVFGEPIIVKQQEENPVNYNKLTTEITDAISKVHVSLDRDEYSGLDAVFFHDLNSHDLIEPTAINQRASEIQDRSEKLNKIFDQKKELEAAGISFPFRPISTMDTLAMFFIAPLALCGLVLNLPVLLPVNWFVNTKIKEIEFVASLKFGFALAGFGIWWWLMGSWIWDYSQEWAFAVLGVLVAILSLISLNGFLRKWKRFRTTRMAFSNEELKAKYLTFVEQANQLRNS